MVSFPFPFLVSSVRSVLFPFRPCVACVASVSVPFRSAVPAFRLVSIPFPSVWQRKEHKDTRKPHEAKQRPRGEGKTTWDEPGRGGRGGGPSLIRYLVLPYGGLLSPNLVPLVLSFPSGLRSSPLVAFRVFLMSFPFRPAYSSVFLVGRGKYSLPVFA
jgi:hypothetical protein